MTDQISSAEAEMLSVLHTMMRQLETEQSWIDDLRKALSQAEKRADRLLTSVEAAMHTLSVPERRKFHLRLRQMQLHDRSKMGRPAKDGRQKTMLNYIAEKGEGTVTAVEIRMHLKARNIHATPQYVSNQVARWIDEGLLTRLSHGMFRINEQSAALRAIRFRKDRKRIVNEMRANLREVRSGLEPPSSGTQGFASA